MYIDHCIIHGIHPLKEFMATDDKGRGSLGQLAARYRENENLAPLRDDPNFLAMLEKLYDADKAILEAAQLIKEENGRLAVGKPREPGDFKMLGKDEMAFFGHLAQARVSLVAACRKCMDVPAELAAVVVPIKGITLDTPVKNTGYIKTQLIGPIEWQLNKLRDKIHAIHPQALIKIESLAQEIAPKQFSFATDALRAYDKGVITQCLKKKFSNYSDDTHSPVVEKIEQILRTQTAAFSKAKRKRGSPDLSPAAEYLKEQFPGFEDQDYSGVIADITETLRAKGTDAVISR